MDLSLPRPLLERLRWNVSPEDSYNGVGKFVLYWMHNALRGHENPALDTAICWARQNGLPLLIYHAISEDYPFASDRIHSFMLQGHRDVQRELSDRGMKSYFHLERSGHCGPHLRDLTRQAAVLVTELMPVQPLAGWLERLASKTTSPIATSDASCILPLTIDLTEPTADALVDLEAYRKSTKDLYQQRVDQTYQEQPVDCEIYQDELPFEPVDLQDVSLAELISQCKVDHSISPVIDTPGGSRPGYARWNKFRDRRLEKYSDDHDQPTGTSRMSAYLHFGMVSPFRIAREADAAGGDDFLDRLLSFRELSFRCCDSKIDDIDTLDALPDWASKSLLDHQGDDRESDLSWETLARGKSDKVLWNVCQRSLLKHGEMHDELRRTWGKSLMRWTSTPGRAMRMALDLNHRYALDGRDPCGYGGVLWCHGQFDRPSKNPEPCYGVVRMRSVEDQQEGLDLDRLNKIVDRPIAGKLPRVAVIGAGFAGLIASRTLVDHGLDVTVFEKSRGVGGRMATRQSRRDKSRQFDHGAQYFTSRDPRLCRYVQSWIHDGLVQPWTGRIVELEAGGRVLAEKRDTLRYVGTPAMNSIARHIASDLTIHHEVRVTQMKRTNHESWQLFDDAKNDLGDFDVVIANCPPAQTLELIDSHTSIANQVRSVKMNPTWAVMLAASGLDQIPYDAAFINEGPLSWIARNNSKPGRRADGGDHWVLHASQNWTKNNLEKTPAKVQTELLDAFSETTGQAVTKIDHCVAHRWLYAIPETPLDQECLWDPTMGIAACGDWCGGPRIEGAFLSGMAAAGSLLRHLTIDRCFQEVSV